MSLGQFYPPEELKTIARDLRNFLQQIETPNHKHQIVTPLIQNNDFNIEIQSLIALILLMIDALRDTDSDLANFFDRSLSVFFLSLKEDKINLKEVI